jgi:hypothetical protein
MYGRRQRKPGSYYEASGTNEHLSEVRLGETATYYTTECAVDKMKHDLEQGNCEGYGDYYIDGKYFEVVELQVNTVTVRYYK